MAEAEGLTPAEVQDIHLENILRVKIDPKSVTLASDSEVLVITPDWNGCYTISRDTKREELESKQDTLKREFKEERRQLIERFRAAVERVHEMMMECDKLYGEMTAECKEASQKLKELKDLTTEKQHKLQRKFELEREDGERRVKDIEDEYAQKRRRERETASSFVLRVKLESLKLLVEVLENISSENLRQVVIQLFLDYHVRLRGIDTGLTFLLDSLSRKEHVLRHDQEIREALSKLFPERHRQRTKWSDLKPCGPFIDYSQLKLGQRMPDRVYAPIRDFVRESTAVRQDDLCPVCDIPAIECPFEMERRRKRAGFGD